MVDEQFRQSISRLLAQLQEPDVPGQEDALSQLTELERDQTIETLVTFLTDEDGQTRGDAAEALMKIDSSRGQKEVVKLLDDVEVPLRWHIVGLLFDFGNSDVTGDLIRVLKTDESGDVRYFAACALGRIGDKSALGPLQEASTTDNGADREGRRVSDAANESIAELQSRQ